MEGGAGAGSRAVEGTGATRRRPDRALWKGLAQIAVGATHAARGNPVGAASLLRRGARGIEGYAGQNPYGVDVDGLISSALAAADQLDDGETAIISPVLRRPA